MIHQARCVTATPVGRSHLQLPPRERRAPVSLPGAQGQDLGCGSSQGPKVTRPTCEASDKKRQAAKQGRGRKPGRGAVFGALDLESQKFKSSCPRHGAGALGRRAPGEVARSPHGAQGGHSTHLTHFAGIGTGPRGFGAHPAPPAQPGPQAKAAPSVPRAGTAQRHLPSMEMWRGTVWGGGKVGRACRAAHSPGGLSSLPGAKAVLGSPHCSPRPVAPPEAPARRGADRT